MDNTVADLGFIQERKQSTQETRQTARRFKAGFERHCLPGRVVGFHPQRMDCLL
jgi:hypothetical protein